MLQLKQAAYFSIQQCEKKHICLVHIGDDTTQFLGIIVNHLKDPVIKPPDFRDSIGLNTPFATYREDWSRLTSAFQLETVPAGHMDCLQVQAAAR